VLLELVDDVIGDGVTLLSWVVQADHHLGHNAAPGAFGLIARIGRATLARMTDHNPPAELPLPCVLDDDDIDRLLERLRAVHGEPRQDIAPGLNRQGRAREAA
jgi:hypothetical protein